MPDNSFRPRTPGRYGAQIVTVSAAIPTLTVNNTTTLRLPTPAQRFYVLAANIQQSTVGADADGTILATLKKRDISAGADRTISAAFDLETQTQHAAAAMTLSGGNDRIGAVPDSLFIDFVNNSAAINTQPVGYVVVQLALLD